MKFSTFFSKTLLHFLFWVTLLFGILAPAPGYENLAVFMIGVMSSMAVVSLLLDGGLKSVNVPGSFFGRVLFQLFQCSAVLLVLVLVKHGHFVAATALMALWFLKATAYRTVRRAERQIKNMLKDCAALQAERDAALQKAQPAAPRTSVDPSAEFDPKATTLELKRRPGAVRDPAFDFPFSASGVTSA